ncbi:MAG: S-methyl-5-thioribose-1-phosphate isomerase [Sedimentisphaerales bacterium]|nr:S-methyl-5-thioribose-1-phosphate isomerase [Sedimentisphaerales bacterium]
MIVKALEWIGGIDGFLEIVDQRKLPADFVKLKCRDVETLFEAIKTLAVRGAPALGVCAAYGLVLSLQKSSDSDDPRRELEILSRYARYLASSRPTAVNLFWALERIQATAQKFVDDRPDATTKALRETILAEANAVCREDVDMCRRIGENGEKFINEGDGILTHCNAGALATAGQGTALSVLFEAHKNKKKFRVYACETRPLLQGARLTAWELKQAGIDVTIICDNMAGWMMKQSKINTVITGADRIAANGDTANKIGTYSLSILAREHGLPFYIAAPSSTFDLSIKSGKEILIEQRAAEEITQFARTQIAPPGVGACNPAFDVTEAGDITAIITEKGVIEKPDSGSILRLLNCGTNKQ